MKPLLMSSYPNVMTYPPFVLAISIHFACFTFPSSNSTVYFLAKYDSSRC